MTAGAFPRWTRPAGPRPGAGRAGLIVLVVLAAAPGWLAIPGCAGGDQAPADPSATVIAGVGDLEVTRRELDAYLMEALGGEENARAAEPEVKSRLLDQLLDEELLVKAAEEQGLEVTDEEARTFLPDGGADAGRVRKVLLQRKYKDQVILSGVKVSDEEIRAFFDANRDRFRSPARAVLRKVLLDSGSEARNVRAELQKEPHRFEEIAETRSLAPDGGRPQAYEEEALPETLRAAVAKLSEGELSQVVEDPQGYFILRLERRQSASDPPLEQVRDQIELHLLQEKSQARYREFVGRLRDKTRVRIQLDKLDFPYAKRVRS
ncbi:MAG TPA: peptidyl-prolyl cis-trans isomerase [Candidatus Polarisedimenticolia bacterium]|nr:peptidyl-prolyl cis-trans isomerase [Candidatus Polarisedimenticolia bacterium]